MRTRQETGLPDGASAETTRFRATRVITIGAVHAVHDTYTGFLPALLPVFLQRLLLSKTEAGLLTVFIQAPSLLQPVIGHLADRFQLRPLVVCAPAVSAIAMSLLGVAPAYGWIVLLLIVAGLSSACIHSVGPVMAGRLSGAALGRGMGVWMVGGELGRVLGPIVIVSALEVLSPVRVPWLMAGGILASLLLHARLPAVSHHRPGHAAALPWTDGLNAMRPLLTPLIVIILARACVLAAITTYLPALLTERGSSLWIAGAALSVVEAAGVAGALAGGWLSDHLGRRSVLSLALLATPVFMIAFSLTTGAAQVVFLALMGFTGLSLTAVIMALVLEGYPDHPAFANGMYMALSFSLRAGVVVVFGAAADAFSLRTAFLASALLSLGGLPAVARLPLAARRPATPSGGPLDSRGPRRAAGRAGPADAPAEPHPLAGRDPNP